MNYILFLISTMFISSALAGPIAGVPNDLRRQFKSIHKFKEIEITLEDSKFLARLDSTHSKTILYYNVPKKLEQSLMLNKIKNDLVDGMTLKLKQDVQDNDYVEYQAQIHGQNINGAWVRVYEAEKDKLAFGLKLPSSSSIIEFKKEKPSGYFLHNDNIVAFQETTQSGGNKVIRFPEKSGLRGREVVNVEAVEDAKGVLTRIKLPKGSFPDQIVHDKLGSIWFTQPADDLLTSFNPESGEWEHISVGPAPDGLTIGRDGKLWFGEYQGDSMGMYDPVTEEYKQFKIPYANPAPAIPYEDKNGLIWISDHQSNKVSVLDLTTEKWEVYEPPVANSWVVQLIQSDIPIWDDIFATHCFSNSIGRIDYLNRVYRDVPLGVSSCPAFLSPVGKNLYISLWSEGSLMKLNTEDGSITEFKINSSTWREGGTGPLASDSDGNVYFASLSNGRVYRFDTHTEKLTYISGLGRTKDGLVIAPDGTVWVAESRTLAKVEFTQ